jgi:DnaK suppressor protein
MQQRGLTPLLRRPKDMPVDDERAAELVRAERQRITDELAGLGIEPAEELSTTDLADDASDLYQEELDAGRMEELRNQLAAVERAEQRLREGSYGVSVESGQPIPDARLEAVPTAERTVEEEERRERGL